MAQFGAQIGGEERCVSVIQGLAHALRIDLEGEPRMIAAREMIAVGAGFATLALLTAGQLFQASLQFFDLPTHVAHLLSDVRGDDLTLLIGDEPVNAAVCGNHLE